MYVIYIFLTAVNALSVSQAANQISASLKKAFPYSVGMQFSRHVETIIGNHYDAFLDIKNPSKRDLISAVKDATEDLQLKSIKMIHNSLSKRESRKGDHIEQRLRKTKEDLLQSNATYQKVVKEESELQSSALDQQTIDFENYLDSLDTTVSEESKYETLSNKPFQDTVMELIEKQLEKETLKYAILDNKIVKESEQKLVEVDPKHKYLQEEKSENIETGKWLISSANIILSKTYERTGIKPEMWKRLQYLSNRMYKAITSNPAMITSNPADSVSFIDIQKTIESKPGSVPILITLIFLLGVGAPPVLFSMFSNSGSEILDSYSEE